MTMASGTGTSVNNWVIKGRKGMSQHEHWAVIRSCLPAERTPLVEPCLQAVAELPGLAEWAPPGPFLEGSLPQNLVYWGFPLTFLADVPSLNPLRKRMGARIGNDQWPEPSDWAEVSAAALVRALGARELLRVYEQSNLTPDFRVWWGSDLVEMEVTRADRKESLIRRTHAQSRINEEIRSLGPHWDIVVHMIDTLCENDYQQVLRSARELRPGEIREDPGRWRVRAETPCRAGNYVEGGLSNAAPDWWPREDAARLFSVGSRFGGQAQDQVQPQVRIQYSTPVHAYMNSATRKAEHFQGSGDVPFLIAVDVMALPGAFEFFARELPEYFAAWPRVSGVLLTHGPAFIGNRLGWEWSLIQNENRDCRHRLPESMVSGFGAAAGTKAFELTTNGGIMLGGCFILQRVS
jgi:hypothetical protein